MEARITYKYVFLEHSIYISEFEKDGFKYYINNNAESKLYHYLKEKENERSTVANGHNIFKAMVIVGSETNACATGKTQTFVCKMTTVCRSQKSTYIQEPRSM